MIDQKAGPRAPVRVLIVDDNPSDVELVRAELRRARMNFELRHAAERAALVRLLEEEPDVILTDFNMPGFSGLETIALAKERRQETPVIIVSGSIGEEQAVTAMKEGASDYLLKDRLARLPQAIERAVEHRRLAHARREAERAHARLASIIAGNPDPVAIADPAGRLLFLNRAGRRLAGLPEETALEPDCTINVLPGPLAALLTVTAPAGTDEPGVRQGEIALSRAEGGAQMLAYTVMVHQEGGGRAAYVSVSTRDLTDRKRAEDRVAALLRIGEKLNSTLDRDELLDALVRESLDLLRARSGCAGIREGERMRCRSYHYRDRRQEFSFAWDRGQGLPGWVLEHGVPYVSNCVDKDPQSLPELDRQFEVEQALCLPIRDSGDEVIGFFEIHNKLAGRFEAGDVDLLLGVARAAAVALTNALAYRRLQGAERRLARHAAGLREIVRLQQEVDSPQRTVDEVMSTALSRIGGLVEADGAVIELLDQDELVYRAATGTAAGQLGMRIKVAGSLSGLCAREGRTLVCDDAATDPRVDSEACRRARLRSMVVVPLSGAGQTIGVLKVYSARPGAFGEDERRSVELLGGLLSTTLQRKRAEEDLQRREQDFRMLFAANPLPMWVHDSETLAILAVNEAAIRHYGYSREEFLAMDMGQVAAGEAGSAPLTRIRVDPPVRGVPPVVRHRTKDGRTILVETSTDTLNFQGRAARLVLAKDVTQQREAEERIAEQARLIDLASDAIIVRDMESRVLFWSAGAERLYGWKRAEAIGQSILKLVYREEGRYAQAMEVTRLQGEWQGELPQVARDGRPLLVASRWTLVTNATGVPRAVLVINTDITEQKKVEQQFLRAQRMESVGTLAGGIAHDLNNVLAPILMSIQLLRMKAGDERTRTMLDTIEKCAQRGADMVKQVLTFARGAQGERSLVQLQHVVRDLEKVIREAFPKNLRVKARIDPQLWLVSGDVTQLHQVLLNLCVNARDAMPEGGLIEIKGENIVVDENFASQSPGLKPGQYVSVTVSDTGTGIPAEVLEKIFEPFFTTKEVGKGTGLGLSTVQAIIRSHGGMIRVYSEVGKGTAFRIYLPASDASEQEAQTDAVGELPRGNGELVLVVDDESSVRTIARQTLEAFGYRVITAANGAEAVANFAQHRAEVQVLLTDMAMPVMDGPATIAAIRQLDPGLPVVATSGLSANGLLARIADYNVRHFLTKPYDAGRLLAVIREAVRDFAMGAGTGREAEPARARQLQD